MEAVLAPGVAAAAKNAKPGQPQICLRLRGLIRNRECVVGRVKWGRKSGEYPHASSSARGRTDWARSHRGLLIKMKQSRRGEGALNLGRGLRVSFLRGVLDRLGFRRFPLIRVVKLIASSTLVLVC